MRAAFIATAVTAALYASPVLAGINKEGPEFPVNTHTVGDQLIPGFAADPSGNVLVVWQDEGYADGSEHGIFGRRFSADENPLGDDFQINTFTAGRQNTPSIAAVSDGFVVAWRSRGLDGDGYAVVAQRLNAEGGRVGDEFVVNTYTTGDQSGPCVAALAGGGFVIAWTSEELLQRVAARVFDAGGVPLGDEFQVNDETTHYAGAMAVAPDAVGGFVVAWSDLDVDFVTQHGRARHVDGTGTSLDPEVDLGTDVYPFLIARPGGDFFVLWNGPSVSDPDGGILGRTLSADASGLGTPFQVNANGPGYQDTPRLAFDALGGFMVTWTDHSGRDGSGNGVYARAFDAAGLPVGDDLLVNATTQLDQDTSAIISTSADHYFAAWTDWSGQDGSTGGVYAQRLTVEAEEPPAPTVTLIRPNGGEQLCAGLPFRIRWSTFGADQLDYLNVSVSTDLGRHFHPIAGCQHLAASATSCLWRSPAPAVRGKALVRVSARTLAHGLISDVSDAPFTIRSGGGPHQRWTARGWPALNL